MTHSTTRALQLYCSSLIVYTAGILLFRYLPYYKTTLSPLTQNTLLFLYGGYILLAPFYYWLTTHPHTTNKPWLFLQAISKYISSLLQTKPTPSLEKEEKVAVLFILVKVFFLPLMLNFFFSNFNHLLYLKDNFAWYPFFLTLVFALDTLIFAFGYTFEFRSMNNLVKSVEPTLLGWIVALISYPPFNGIVGSSIPWGANDYATFGSTMSTSIVRTLLCFLLLTYLWATFALGAKASNLTNRGIVTKFPYSIVRHPAYISKNLIWWITLLPFLNWQFALGMAFWSCIYFLRAITEERHLSQDPDYLEYRKKVRWRFIPYIV